MLELLLKLLFGAGNVHGASSAKDESPSIREESEEKIDEKKEDIIQLNFLVLNHNLSSRSWDRQ